MTLTFLEKAKPKMRKAIISKCSPDLLKFISEVALNALRGNVQLSSSCEKKLKKHRGQIRKLADKRVPLAKMKRLIVQKGGFLLPLLFAVLPAIPSLIFNKI